MKESGGRQGDGRPGEKGAGGAREAGEEGAGRGIPMVAGGIQLDRQEIQDRQKSERPTD